VCCSVSQCVAVCCSVLQCVARVLQCVARVLQCVARVLQCIAVCCSVLQCVAMSSHPTLPKIELAAGGGERPIEVDIVSVYRCKYVCISI